MNTIKLLMFFIACIFSCHTHVQVQAMDRIAENFHAATRSGNHEKMRAAYFETLFFLANNNVQYHQKTDDGFIYSTAPISNNHKPLQSDEILRLIPPNIEFSDKTDELVFNIIATYKFFKFVAQDQNHGIYALLLPKSLQELKKEDFQLHVHEFHMRCTTHLGTLRLPNGKKDKIRKMVDKHLQTIIEKMQVNNAHNNNNN